MLVLFILLNSDHIIEKIHVHVEMLKDMGSLAEGPDQLVIRIKEKKE